jgi:hypothetical protein
MIDQKTYDLVVNLARARAQAGGWGFELFGVTSVSIIGVDALVDMARIEGLPTMMATSVIPNV